MKDTRHSNTAADTHNHVKASHCHNWSHPNCSHKMSTQITQHTVPVGMPHKARTQNIMEMSLSHSRILVQAKPKAKKLLHATPRCARGTIRPKMARRSNASNNVFTKLECARKRMPRVRCASKNVYA